MFEMNSFRSRLRSILFRRVAVGSKRRTSSSSAAATPLSEAELAALAAERAEKRRRREEQAHIRRRQRLVLFLWFNFSCILVIHFDYSTPAASTFLFCSSDRRFFRPSSGKSGNRRATTRWRCSATRNRIKSAMMTKSKMRMLKLRHPRHLHRVKTEQMMCNM